MSRGLGRVRKRLDVILRDNPDGVLEGFPGIFPAWWLANRIYGTEEPTKDQRTVIIRGVKALCLKRPEYAWTVMKGRGMGLIVYNTQKTSLEEINPPKAQMVEITLEKYKWYEQQVVKLKILVKYMESLGVPRQNTNGASS